MTPAELQATRVEAAARSLFSKSNAAVLEELEWERVHNEIQLAYLEGSTAALAAADGAAEEAGYVLVPIEPTPSMIAIVAECVPQDVGTVEDAREFCAVAYRAMLAARPKVEGGA